MKFTNAGGIPLSLAVWLATDDYDHSDDPDVISATSLLKPIRAIVLARQNRDLLKVGDVESMIPSRMGTALHDSIERSWKNNYKQALTDLNFPPAIAERVLINPEDSEIKPDSIVIYMEIRGTKQVGKFKVSGKFDFCAEGGLEDFKSTGTYSFISGSHNEKYMQQGSIYRWLHPDKVKSDIMTIQFIFTDWSKVKSLQEKDYPKKRLQPLKLNLMSIPETEAFVKGILNKVELLENAPQEQLPQCTPEELWQKDAVFKYYKDPAKTTRSTKNFTNSADAYNRLQDDGNVGVIKEIKGEVVRCKYCDVIGLCDQAKDLIESGLLII